MGQKSREMVTKFDWKDIAMSITDEFEDITSPPISEQEKLRSNKMQELKELVNEFMDKRKDLQEFEKELKKNKHMLTPGQVGES